VPFPPKMVLHLFFFLVSDLILLIVDPFVDREGGMGNTKGYKVVGSKARLRNFSVSNKIPVNVLKHSRIIQRREIRARE
jgi:hypothetical protein